VTDNGGPTAKGRADRAEGILLGLACGDALGRPVEFKTQAQIKRRHGRVTEMLSHGTHNQPAGTVTDDTDMAQCIAASLIEQGRFDPADVAQRFVAWYESDPFDIGIMTTDSLRRIQRGESWRSAGVDVWRGKPEGSNAGNGSIMRCAPYAIVFADQPETLTQTSLVSSGITHADPRCTYGSAILNLTLAGYLRGEEHPLATTLQRLRPFAPRELVDALDRVPDEILPDALSSSGYVVHTLQTALYHGLTASNPKEGICNAVNMGQDTDTVGAVTGAIVGARFGARALPDSWLRSLSISEALRANAGDLLALSES